MSKKDYYELLGIGKSATDEEIKSAYRKMAMKHHPDKNQGDKSSEKKFKEINDAYEVLKDKQKRAAYDSYGHDAFNESRGYGGGQGRHHGGYSGGGSEFDDIFSAFGDMMNNGGSRRGSQSQTKIRGSDLKYGIEVSLEEAFSGVAKNISFSADYTCSKCDGHGSRDRKSNACRTCNGSGTVRFRQGFFAFEQACNACGGVGVTLQNPCDGCGGIGRKKQQRNLQVTIPPGIQDGMKIRLQGEGESGVRGGGSGDLYVFVTVKEHPLFQVQDHDIHCRVPVSFTMAILGGEINIPDIEGGKIKLKIPEGSQHGDKLRVKGKGMPVIRSSSRKDMYIHIHVEIPKNLSAKHKSVIEKIHSEIYANSGQTDESFFAKMRNLWK